jgi:sensor histidine kinase regulating citrate/malate metabolism
MAKDFLALTFVSFVSLYITMTLTVKDSVSDNMAAIINLCISLGLFIANIFIFNLFLKSSKYAKIEMEQSLILQNIESSEKRYGEVIAIQNQIRSMWHDINNHIAVVKGMVASEEGSAAKYIDELEKKIGEYASHVAFGNTIIDSVLYTKTAKAKELGIEINSSLEMDKNIRISPIDLCTIFSNALDNAIEACEEVDPGKRFILLKAVQNQGFLFIKIINSSENRKKSGNEFLTTKKEKSRHGIGLKSIQNAADSYSGTVNTDYKDGIFELSILLNTI